MAHVIMTREGAIRHAAELAADGQDTRHLASEQTAYADDIARVTKLVWDDGYDVDEAVDQVLGETHRTGTLALPRGSLPGPKFQMVRVRQCGDNPPEYYLGDAARTSDGYVDVPKNLVSEITWED